MNRALRDPRLRILVAAAVLALALLLSWHLVVMGTHGMAMMLGLCLVVLAAVGVLLVSERPVLLLEPLAPLAPLAPLETPQSERVEPLGWHPPDEGIRLRH